MILKIKKLYHLLKVNKIKLVLLFIFLLSLFFILRWNQKVKNEKALEGFWMIDLNKSTWDRYKTYKLLNYDFEFENNSVFLPVVNTELPYSYDKKKSTGTWELDSHNPDSIFINAPESPFFGTYKIKLFRDEGILYKIELTNDSTFIVCIKGSMAYKE